MNKDGLKYTYARAYLARGPLLGEKPEDHIALQAWLVLLVIFQGKPLKILSATTGNDLVFHMLSGIFI